MFWSRKKQEQKPQELPEPPKTAPSVTGQPAEKTDKEDATLIFSLETIRADNRVKDMLIVNISEKLESINELNYNLAEIKMKKKISFFEFMRPYLYVNSELSSAGRAFHDRFFLHAV